MLMGMQIDSTTHTPWAQLPFEARFLFILFFSGVFGPEDLEQNAVVRELAKIWDAEQLTLGFLKIVSGSGLCTGIARRSTANVYGVLRLWNEPARTPNGLVSIMPSGQTDVAEACRGGRYRLVASRTNR